MVAIYCRQSVDKQDSISIETQIEACKRQLRDDEQCTVYHDKGYSGSNTNRPDFQKMMNDIRAGKISKVIVYKIDRISRSLLDFTNINAELERYKVKFCSANESFDTSTPAGNAAWQIVMVFAELERKTIQQRITDNFYDRAKKGLFLAGQAPLGYKKIPYNIEGLKTHILEEDPETSRIVKHVFERYLLGDSLGQILRGLNNPECEYYNENIKFSCVKLSRMLANPVYVRANADIYMYYKVHGAILHNDIELFDGKHGCTIYGCRKEKTKSKFRDLDGENIQLNLHEGFIEADDWLKVQVRLSQNKAMKNNGKGTHSWLSGIIKCGYCNMALTVVNGQRNGKRYVSCGGRKNGICYKRERGMTFDEIEEGVSKILIEHIKNFKFNVRKNKKKYNDEINKLKAEQAKLEAKRLRIVDSFIDITERDLRRDLEAQHAEVMKHLKEVSEKISNLSTSDDIQIDIDDIVRLVDKWGELSLEQKKGIAKIFINKVVIYDDTTPAKIEFKSR